MKEPKALTLVDGLLRSRGAIPERLTVETYGNRKMPDYCVSWGDGGLFYCEVKTPELKLSPSTGLYMHRTTHSKLRRLLHTASKQFDSVNRHHLIPNVLIWICDDFMLNWHTWAECVTGFIEVPGTVLHDFTKNEFFARTQAHLYNIDIHIWLQANSDRVYQETFFWNGDSGDVARRLVERLLVGESGEPAGDVYTLELGRIDEQPR